MNAFKPKSGGAGGIKAGEHRDSEGLLLYDGERHGWTTNVRRYRL